MVLSVFTSIFLWLFPWLGATVCHVNSSGMALDERILFWNLQTQINEGDLEGSCEGRCFEACSDNNPCTVDVEESEPDCMCNQDHPLIALAANEKCCEVSGIVVPRNEECCALGADECAKEVLGFQYDFHEALFDELIPQAEDSVPFPLYTSGDADVAAVPLQLEGSTLGGTDFTIQITEIVFKSQEILDDIQDDDNPFTDAEIASLTALDFQATTFFGKVENEELLGLLVSYTGGDGNLIGYMLPIDEPSLFGFGEDRRRMNEATTAVKRQAQASGCSNFVQEAIALFDCSGTVIQDAACVAAARVAYEVTFGEAQAAFNLAVDAARAIKVAADLLILRAKVKAYQRAAIICTLVGALGTPLAGALCMARQAAIIEGPAFLAKKAAQLAFDAAVKAAQDNLLAAIDLACSTARIAVGACLECCESENTCGSECCSGGLECCDGTCREGPCCDVVADPCCDSDDPCCGSEDTCCGSSDQCCGSNDPCCGNPECDEGGANGDPHFRTFDKLRYSCQGKGDFVLFKASSGLECHVRFKTKSNRVTLASGVALTAGGNAPSIELNIGVDDGTLNLFVDGSEVDHLSGYDDAFYRVATSNRDNSIFVKSAGVTIHADIRLPGSFPHFNVRAVLAPTFKQGNTICGLLGSPDGNPSNDWSTPTCDPIPVPTTRSELHNQGGYDYCIANWCIRDESESLFSYSQEFPFEFFSGCDTPFPGSVDVSSAPAEVQDRCGTDLPCLIDGAELGVEGSQSLLEAEAILGSASPLKAAPSAVVAGVSTNVAITVDYASRLSQLPDGTTSFIVYRVDPDTREIGTTPIVELVDTGSGIGGDTAADDGIFSNMLAVRADMAGETFGFHALPMINGVVDTRSPLAISNLQAVQSYSPDAGIGVVSSGAPGNIKEASIAELTMVVQYSWPSDQSDLDSGTFFLDSDVGFGCGASKYMDFTKDITGTGGTETTRIRLGESYADKAWASSVSVSLNSGWHDCGGRGPASASVFTEKPGTSGSLIVGSPITFAIDPGCQPGCATTLVGRLDVVVDQDGNNVEVAVLSLSDIV